MTALSGKRAFVTGATGFLGSHLVKRLSDDGANVIALARRPNRDRYICDLPSVQIVMGDVSDSVRMQELITPEIDIVFHVAAAMSGKLLYQRKVSVEGTRHVAQASADANVSRFVHVSSIAIYGFPPPLVVTEETPAVPTNVPYNLAKREAEMTLREVAQNSKLDYSIIRPAMIYGPRSNTWTRMLFRIAKRNPTWFIGDGSGHSHPIHVDDVVDLMLTLASHSKAKNEAFNCAPDHAPTWREFMGSYSQLAGHQNWRAIPIGLVKTFAPIADLLSRINGEPQDVPQMLQFLTSETTFCMDKARELLNWQPQVELESGVQSCIPYLREKGLLD